MKFQTNPWTVINRDWERYAADEQWLIDLPEKYGKAYKLESLEIKITTNKKKKAK